MAKRAVFHIEGGIGKHIAATAVIECYRKQNKDREIIVVCAWPEIFLNNKFIDRVYRINNVPHFYKDFIHNKDVEIFAQEPYKTTSHILKRKHLIESWCSMIGIKYNDEKPRLALNFREREIASRLIQGNDKPLLIFQPFGGPGKEHQQYPYSWMRDIHPEIAQILVNTLNEKYHVVHVCYDFHPQLNNCTRFDQVVLKKVLFGLLETSQARLLIDSSLQHAAAALGLPSTVVWIATQPEVFGYDIHSNIKPKIQYSEGTVDSYLYDYNFTGSVHECPYESPQEIFDIDQILKTL